MRERHAVEDTVVYWGFQLLLIFQLKISHIRLLKGWHGCFKIISSLKCLMFEFNYAIFCFVFSMYLLKTLHFFYCSVLYSRAMCSKHLFSFFVSFLLVVVQFGVTDAMHGLAAMLKLVWVPANSIKSAVVQAFRLLYLYSDDTGESR